MRWATPWRLVATEGVGAGLVALAGLTTSRPGTFLSVVAAGLFAGLAARDGLRRPSIEATAERVCVVSGFRRVCGSWGEVAGIAATETRRLIMQRSLEVEIDGELIVVPARCLGARPSEVAAALERLRAAAATAPPRAP